MWCPKCKSEYREGFTVCAECGAPLVRELPNMPDFDAVLLAETEGDSAWELPELLSRAGIACYLYGGNGAFVRVDPAQAVPGELYVNRDDLPTARRCVALLSGPPQPVEEEVLLEAYESYMSESPEPEEEREAGNVAWKIFLVLALVAIGCVLASVFLR